MCSPPRNQRLPKFSINTPEPLGNTPTNRGMARSHIVETSEVWTAGPDHTREQTHQRADTPIIPYVRGCHL